MGAAAVAPLNMLILALAVLFTFAQYVQASHQVEHIGDDHAEPCEICFISSGSDDLVCVEDIDFANVAEQRETPCVFKFLTSGTRHRSHHPRDPPSVTPAA